MSENTGYLPLPKGFSTAAIHAGQDPEQWDSMCVVPPLVQSTTFKQYGPGNFKLKMSNKSEFLPLPKSFSTKAIHSGHTPDQWNSMCVVPPIVMSTTFKQIAPAIYKKYQYGRAGNPTREVLEKSLAEIEDAKYGLCLASGLGALNIMMSLLNTGDHMVSCDDMYGGSFRLLEMGKQFGIELTAVNSTVLENVEKAMRPNTRLIFVESPTNPRCSVMDIKAIAEIAKKHNAIFAVDNTFLTSYFQRPLSLGADISVYSLTKYVNGHSDVMMGAVVTNNKELADKMKLLQNDMGIVPSPFDCSLVVRSLNTLSLRMKQHNASSIAIATFLENHPKVLKVLHPGLKSHPQHELAKRQSSGHSGMIAVYLKGGLEESKMFVKALKVFTLGGSLGGVQSLIAIPLIMTHAAMSPELLSSLDITGNFMRLSIGLEDTEDLIEDIKQALETI